MNMTYFFRNFRSAAAAPMLCVALFSLTASASEEHAASTEHHGSSGHREAVDKPTAVAQYAFHHVSDDEQFELEFPWGGHAPALQVAEWFSFLKFESDEGACTAAIPASFSAAPSIGKWLNGCYDLRPTKAALMLWFAIVIVFAVIFAGNKRDANGVPKGRLTNAVEALVLFVRNEIAIPNIGKVEASRYTPYLLSLFFFVLTCNWMGLIPGIYTGTSALGVTAALAILTFLLTQIAGIRAAGVGGYLSHLTGGVHPALWFIMIPVEILGLFTKPFALLIRLFANMLAGHLMLTFVLSLIVVVHVGLAAVAVPLTAAMMCLEIFVGILQAYLFTLLTSVFIGQGIAIGHHHDEHAH